MPDPLLTVVTVTYNARDSFEQTLASIRGQSARDRIEYLVVDGASTDGTIEAIRAASDRGEIDRWVSEPDRGIYDAMNKAASLARGEYLLYVNAGDVLPSGDTLAPLWGLEGRPAFLWGDCEIRSAETIVLDRADRMLRFLYRQMTVSHQSLAVRTDLLRAHPFDGALKVAADYEVLCWLVSNGHQGRYFPRVLSRIEEEGFSSRNFFLGLEEKKTVSRRYFPREQWRARPYFALWGLYMKLKILYKERS